MSSFSTLFNSIAADAYDETHAFHRIEDAIFRAQDLYDLDGETFLRNREGRVETGTPEAFEREVWP